MELTPRQQDAVSATGSVAVTAGAGTGKTAMLAARFVHQVVEDELTPLEIAAVTFTEKAAAELRARIRKELAKVSEERAAEADAAQISTIHSLAARLCRDFYDLAGIPADFRMLDETDAELVVVDWFDEILAKSDPEIIAKLGYTWLRDSLRELMADPPAAEKALWFDLDHYRRMMDERRSKALADLQRSDCWTQAKSVLNDHFGLGDDKMEPQRVAVLKAMADISCGRSVEEALSTIGAVNLRWGSKSNWRDDSLDLVKGCIKTLREALGARGEFENICLAYGRPEEEMHQQMCMLRHVFLFVRQQLQAAKLERGVLDFADLEYYAQQVLENAEVRQHYAERWKSLLVDEFQDTNPEQEKLLERLTSSGAKLTIVGDGKQSIYGFRRADPRVFERFRRKIGNDIVLDKTFRTHSGLVTPLNKVFAHLLGESHQPLEAYRTDFPHGGPFVEAHSFCDDSVDIAGLRRVEGRYIAGEIVRILNDKLPVWDKNLKGLRPVEPRDIAILCRTRAPLDTYIDELIDAEIPAVNTGGGDLLDTQVAKDLSVLIRFCSDPSDDIALVALLRGPFCAVDDKTLFDLSLKKQRDESWWQLLTREHISVTRPFELLGKLLETSRSVPADRLVEIADELTGFTAVIRNLRQGERRMTDWHGFISLLRRFASLGRSDVVGADRYLKDIARAGNEIPRPPMDAGNCVSLMTIHAAKGLEWPVVFVPNLSANKRSDGGNVCFDAEMGIGFKVMLRGDDGKYSREEPAMLKLIRVKKKADAELEAMRVLYVAMTRAGDRLYLTSAGKEARDFLLLQPGLEAAEIDVERHDAGCQPPVSRFVDCSKPPKAELTEQLASIAPHFDSIAVSGLVEYSICPRRFQYQYVDGHPGVGDGPSGDARTIGTLTHTALELDLRSPDELRPFSDGESDEVLTESIELATVFREGEDFRAFRLGNFEREAPVRFELNGANISGKADLVGNDYVLDFKTDSEMLPDGHAVQLWAYAHALGKERAFIAYLRHRKLHEFTLEQLGQAKIVAERSAQGILSADFVSTPSESACRYCAYSLICRERHKN